MAFLNFPILSGRYFTFRAYWVLTIELILLGVFILSVILFFLIKKLKKNYLSANRERVMSHLKI